MDTADHVVKAGNGAGAWWRGKGRGKMGDTWLSVNNKRLKQLFIIHSFIFIHQKLFSIYHIL